MSFKRIAANTLQCLRAGLATIAIAQFALGASIAGAAPNNQTPPDRDGDTITPIKHVIVIIGENRSFDHVFATYVPKHGQTVMNLLSEGIIKADGTPGRNFYRAEQTAAIDDASDEFLLNPDKVPFQGDVLPAPLVGGPKVAYVPNNSLADAQATEDGLPANYLPLLLTGGTGQTSATPDQRIKDVNSLPPGPFQITNGNTFSYDDYAASPVHRFYQMWQQLDCSTQHATFDNPSGCNARLFPWVEVTEGAGSNGVAPASNFSTEYSSTDVTTGEGSTSMAFYNVQEGDVPYFKYLADNYAMSDNFHQSVNGGTGANHIMLGHGDMIFFSDGKGDAEQPPHGVKTGTTSAGTPAVLDEVENPNALGGTNNWYTEDGYGGGSYGSPAYGGGSYTDCADLSQPAVAQITKYLSSLPRPIKPNCQSGHYYLLNNYNPGYFGNGNDAFTDNSPFNTAFTIPPSSVRSIGDELIAANVSWKYYGDQWNAYVNDPYQINYGAVGTTNPLGQTITTADEYCTICNPFQYDTSIMANPTVRAAHIQDTTNLYSDIANGTLPAVSFVKPSGFVDGHPASSKLDLFEGFTEKIVNAVQANPELWNDTAIFITFDEGGGYYDSGYVQPLDYFGDGTRIPLIVVSKYSTGGRITHNYSDHVSILKFIERNWGLGPVTGRSRDNDPDPIALPFDPYVPINSPAISDLFELFNFGNSGGGYGH